MKALTIQQPWAHLIVNGAKRIENRSWKTKYRGPLLIHAGKSTVWMDKWFRTFHMLPPTTSPPYGAIIGVCELVNCVELSVVKHWAYAEGPFCWVLKNVRAIAPIPYKGKQGIFEIPDAVVGPIWRN